MSHPPKEQGHLASPKKKGRFLPKRGILSALFILTSYLTPHTSQAQLGDRQREIWIPEKSLPQILAANPKAVILTREEYKTLIKDAGTPIAQALQKPPVPALLRSAHYKGLLTGNTIVAEAEFSIDCLANDPNSWQSIVLPIDLAALASVKLDQESALRLVKNAEAHEQCTVLLRAAGRHTLTASFFIPIEESPAGSTIRFPGPQAPAAHFALELPERYTLRDEPIVSTAKAANGNFIHTVPLPNDAGMQQLTWRARDIAPLAGGAVLQTCSYLYQIDPVRITSDLGIVLRSALARVPRDIKIPLPESAKVLSVEGPDVLMWTLEKNTIFLSFSTAELRETSLRILLESPPMPSPPPSSDLTAVLPQPAVEGVHRASGFFAILAAPDVRVRSIATAGLTAQTTTGLPGDAAKQPGFVAGFAFPLLSAAPSITFQQLQPRFQADQLQHIQLRRDTIELRRTIRILVKEGEIFTTTLHIPPGEETTILTLADNTEPNWKTISPGVIEIKWPAAVTPTRPGTVTVVSRMDPEGWFTLGEKPRNLTFASATLDGPELTTGYVALDFDERFHVSTTAATGLEPTDPSRLAANGVPLTGSLTWTRADAFTLDLAVSRRPSEVHAHITAYALPLLHTCEVEGQIELDVRNSGLRSLLIAAPLAVAEHLRFDSPLIAEKKLQPLTGEWTLTFHEELTGHPKLRYHWSLPFAAANTQANAQQRFSLSLPVLKLPEAGRVTGTWIVEANTDTELTLSPQGLDDRDTITLPVVENYTPQHRVIAAYGWRGSAWQLGLEGTRHPAAPLPGLVIDDLNLQSILNPDGTQRHQMVFRLRSNGEQFFQCPLPNDAHILSLTIDGEPLKPVADPVLRAKNQNGLRVQLPATIEARPATIQLTYELPAAAWDSSGKLELQPPALNPNIPVLTTHWLLHLPEGYTYTDFSGNLQKEFEMPTKTLASAVLGKSPEILTDAYSSVASLFRKNYVGRVKLQVHHDAKGSIFEKEWSGSSRTWLETEFKIITSRETLLRVVREKNLAQRWNLGNNENAAADKLSKLVETEEERGTDIISIVVRSPDPHEAAELANSVADAYEFRRNEYEKSRSEAAVAMLQMELDNEEKKVEEKRIGMLSVMKKYNIIDFSGVHSQFAGMTGAVDDGKEETYKSMAGRMGEYEQEVTKLRAQLKILQETPNPATMIEQAAALNLEGPVWKDFYPKYQAAKLELSSLQAGGLDGKHPKVIALTSQVKELEKILADLVKAQQKSIGTKIEIAETGLKFLRGQKNDLGSELVGDKARQSEYMMAKREYEQQFSLLNEMREHILKQKVDLEMPRMPVQRHENAYPEAGDEITATFSVKQNGKDVADFLPGGGGDGPKGKTVRIAPTMPQPLFAGTPLPMPTRTPASRTAPLEVPAPAKPEAAPEPVATADIEKDVSQIENKTKETRRKSGLIPLDIVLPESGRTFAFAGNHLPGTISLSFTSWRRELQIAWLYILLGAAAAWFLAKQRPIFIGLLIGLMLHFIPSIFSAGLQKPCNGILLGWAVTCGLMWIILKLKRRLHRSSITLAPAASVAALLMLSVIQGHAETSPTPYTAFVPFDSSKPLTDQAPARYFLTYETFQKLWKQARENRAEAAKPAASPEGSQPAWATIQTALYNARVEGNRLLLDATLSLYSSGKWATADLLFRGASIGALTLDGAAAPLQDGKLLLEKSGPHTVTAKLEIPLPQNWQLTETTLPQAAASLVALHLTEMSARIKINGGLPTVETATADGVPTRIITAALGHTTSLRLERSLSAAMANQADKIPTSAQVTSALYLTPALQRLESTVQYQFPGIDHQEFSLEIDPSITPISLDIPNLETWSLNTANGKKALTFRVALPVRDSLQIKLTGERPTPPSPSQETFPALAPGAVRSERTLLLLAVDELDIKPQPATTLQQTDFPDLKGADTGFQRIACYTSAGPLVPFAYQTQRRALTANLQADYLYQISPSKLEIHTVLSLQPARGQDLLQTTLQLPAGFTVTRVDSDRLQDWWVEENRLRVRFSGPTPETTTLLLGLAQSWKEPPAKLELAPLLLENIGKVRGRAQLATLPDVNVQLNFAAQKTSAIREIGPGEKRDDYPPIGDFKLTTPFETKREFTFDVADFTASVALGKVPAKFDTRWVLAAEVQESWVRLEARCDVEVKAGALAEFTLALPATALASGEPRVTGELIREVTKLPTAGPNDPATYKISLQRPIITATQFTVSLEIPHNGEIHLPDLTFPDSGINERYIVVQNASAGELHYMDKRSVHVEPLKARDVERELHFRIENFTQPIYFRAGPDWDLAMSLEKLATTTGTKALVLYAELTTALRSTGEEWLKADYRLQNRSLQFLPVRLPAGFELLSAIVSGQPVRADLGQRDNQPVLLIPLIQTRPGDLALDVQLICRKIPTDPTKLPTSLQLSLDDPELPGVTIERTVWRVALPPEYELKDNKGNMDKVADDTARNEKYSATVNEITSLISLSRSQENSVEVRERSKRNAITMCQNAHSDFDNGLGSAPDAQILELSKQLHDITIAAPTQSQAEQTISGSTWNWSENSGYLKQRDQKQSESQKQEAQLNKDNLGLNDNVITGNRKLYFKYNAAPEQAAGKAQVELNSRSSAVSKLQQVDDSDEKTVTEQLKKIESQRRAINVPQTATANGGMLQTDGTLNAPQQQAAQPLGGNVTGANADILRNNVDFQQNYQNATSRQRFDVNGLGTVTAANGPMSAEDRTKSVDESIKQADQLGKSGRFDDAKAILNGVLAKDKDPENARAKMLLKRLDDPDYYNPALTESGSQSRSPKLRPAGRVSLPVDFPITTGMTYFKKVKDQAALTLTTERVSENHSSRLSSVVWLATSLILLLILNAVKNAHSRRRSTLARA